MGNTGRGVLRKYVNGVNVTIAQFRLAKGSVVKPHSHRLSRFPLLSRALLSHGR